MLAPLQVVTVGLALRWLPCQLKFSTLSLALVRRWSAKGTWPKVWNDIRQVHLRKNPGFGPVYAKDLRPIAVLSIWYRSLISALTRNPLLQTWLLGVAPRACHGGLKGRSVTTAVASLLPHLEPRSSCFGLGLPEMLRYVAPGVGCCAPPSSPVA